MRLGDCANFIQGTFINRIQTSKLNEESETVHLLTLKEFNETLGLSYRISQDKNTEIYVRGDKLSKELFTDSNSLVMHTLSQKVAFLPKKYSGLLLTNNFVKILFTEPVNLYFMEWYLNEHPTIQKQITLFSEGSVISSLKLSHIKDIEVLLPPYEEQKKMGKITILKKKKEQLLKEKIQLEQQVMHQQLVNIINRSTQEVKK
ncbi:restriction endonuclease subunit S [Bacillus toyonensis]|uniref:restriction endonuclease subunit S n=1 Tax=Bacillus toyonensis TaxID=155322 RepID=UPI000BEB2EE6|nr:restriction endonuclease subunit S [Bacillus toyonensis]PDZ86116.1 restriction endonuclease subunit S [Bacillus toyonensis]PEA71050.1 restriction endonuclease subunit S [Bacillus toyonensis]